MEGKIKARELVVYSFFRTNLHSSVELLMIAAPYTLLTLAMTYPLILYFGRAIPGWQGDQEFFVWSLWWIKYALVDLHTNFGLTNYVFYPNTVNLLSADQSPVNGLLSVILQPAFGVIGSFDALYLFSFVASGIGTYMLLRYLGCSRYAAFLGGAIFAFAPYRFAHSFGHFGLLTTEWIPFFVLCLAKAIREGRSTYFALAPLFFFMTVYGDAYYAVILGALSVVLLLLHWKQVSAKAFIKKAVRIGVPASLVLGAPLLWLGIDAIERHSLSNVAPAPWEVVFYSADVIAYMIPSVFNLFVGRYVSGIASRFTGNSAESTITLGYMTLFLVGYAVAKLRKSRDVKVWGVVMIVFFLLSLGPVLHIMGRTTFTEFQVTVPMPYIVLYELLPVMRAFRGICRFALVVMLGATILSGLAITDILSKISLRLPRLSRIAAAAMLAIILLEFAVAPIPMHVISVSPFYRDLAEDTRDFAILDLPQDPRMTEAGFELAYLYMYYQTIHHKKIVGGIIPRAPESIMDFTDRAPIVSDLVNPLKCTDRCDSPDIISVDATVAQNVLAYFGIQYVILHRDIGLEKRMHLDQRLLSIFFDGYPPIYEDEHISVYRTVGPDHFLPFLRLENGWGDLEIFPMNIPTRWISNDSSITVFNPSSTSIQLQFSAASLHGPRTLEVYADNQLVTTLGVPENRFRTFQIILGAIPGQPITIRLHPREWCEIPKSLGINEDPRCLSVVFREFQVTEVGAGSEQQHSFSVTTKDNHNDLCLDVSWSPACEASCKISRIVGPMRSTHDRRGCG